MKARFYMKAQGATEYLVLLGAILFVALMASVVLFWPVGSTSDVKQSQADIKYKIRAMEHPELTQGLIAYYKFDEGIGDTISNAVGNVNNGIMTNGTWVDGKSGKAVRFSGTGYISFSSPITSSLNGFTATYWVNLTSFAGSTHPSLQTIYINAQNVYRAAVDNTGHPVGLFTYQGTLYRNQTSSSTLSLNAWHFIAITFDGSTISIYLNGSPVSITAATHSAPSSNLIGAFATDRGFVSGSMDDVRIYNRVLSASEIALLYKNPGYP